MPWAASPGSSPAPFQVWVLSFALCHTWAPTCAWSCCWSCPHLGSAVPAGPAQNSQNPSLCPCQVTRERGWPWFSSLGLFLTQTLLSCPISLSFGSWWPQECPLWATGLLSCHAACSCRSSQPSQLPDTSAINFHLLSSCQKSEQTETLEELYRNPCLDAHLLPSPIPTARWCMALAASSAVSPCTSKWILCWSSVNVS